MDVVHIITRLIIGGAQENTLATVLGLRAKPNVRVRLFSGPSPGREGSLEAVADAQPGLFHRVPALVRPLHPWHDTRAYVDLTRRLRRDRPDIVHTHSGKAGVLGRWAARRARVPVIFHTIHGPSFGPWQGPLANTLFRAAERWAAHCTTHFVTVAEAMTQQYLAAGIGQPNQYTCVRSGFELATFAQATPDPALAAQLGIQPGDFVVGTIARLFRLKGHDDLLSIAPMLVRAVPRIRFLWVGDGPWRRRFERRVRELGLGAHVRFAGLVPPEQVAAHVALMDVLVHLSRREGLARALPQALAAGRPVIAYDCDGAGEICRTDKTGYLVAPGDTGTLAGRLRELEADPGLRERLGRTGQAWVQDRFGLDLMIDRLHRLYLEHGLASAVRSRNT